MAKETRVEESTCAVPVFERNRYFYGKPMTVRDFEAEQRYLIGKSQFLNRLLHGPGILRGLQVSVAWDADSQQPAVQLTEGAALDCCGNVVVVSRTGPVTVEGVFADGLNYLSIQYAECIKQPIMASTNASSCQEVCCYNRVQETFRVSVSQEAPVAAGLALAGSVREKATGRAIAGARVEALTAGRVVASTLTDPQGAYTLRLNPGDYDVRAAASGFAPASETRRHSRSSSATPLPFNLDAATAAPDPSALCDQLTQAYFEEHLSLPPECHDPKVFVAAVEIKPGTMRGGRVDANDEVVALNPGETRKYRSVVNGGPMLHDLLCAHLSDFNNPHRTDASHVRALQTINHVGNLASGPHHANVDLVSADQTITLTPSATDNAPNIDIKLSPDAVTRAHLNAADVFNDLISSPDRSINVSGRPSDRRVELSLPAPQKVTNVGATASVGTSKTPAREDHVHALDINGRSPDANGKFLLTPGPNTQITQGRSNELIIDARAGGSDVTTGTITFNNMHPGEERMSPPISHGLTASRIAVVMSLEYRLEGNGVTGDFAQRYPMSPLLIAYTDPSQPNFRIQLKDRHPVTQPPPFDESVRPPEEVIERLEIPQTPPITSKPQEEIPTTSETSGKLTPGESFESFVPVARPAATEETATDQPGAGDLSLRTDATLRLTDATPKLSVEDTVSLGNTRTEADLSRLRLGEKLTPEETLLHTIRFAEATTAANRSIPGAAEAGARIIGASFLLRNYRVRWWAFAAGRDIGAADALPNADPFPEPGQDFSYGQSFPREES